MSDGQLSLFAEPAEPVLTGEQAGLRSVPPGAERLLGELVRRGIGEDALEAAARLCLLLDEGRPQ